MVPLTTFCAASGIGAALLAVVLSLAFNVEISICNSLICCSISSMCFVIASFAEGVLAVASCPWPGNVNNTHAMNIMAPALERLLIVVLLSPPVYPTDVRAHPLSAR